jgi:hypothetical protein
VGGPAGDALRVYKIFIENQEKVDPDEHILVRSAGGFQQETPQMHLKKLPNHTSEIDVTSSSKQAFAPLYK